MQVPEIIPTSSRFSVRRRSVGWIGQARLSFITSLTGKMLQEAYGPGMAWIRQERIVKAPARRPRDSRRSASQKERIRMPIPLISPNPAALNQVASPASVEATGETGSATGPDAFGAFLNWVRNNPEKCDPKTLGALCHTSRLGNDYGTAASCLWVERSIHEAMRQLPSRLDDVLNSAEKFFTTLEQDAQGIPGRSCSWKGIQPLVEIARKPLALAKEAENAATLDTWNRVCDRIAGTPEGEQARPLYALGIRIEFLPASERSAAMQRFRSAVEALAPQYRHGLLGLHHAASGDPELFYNWETQAVDGPIRREISNGPARFSYDERSEIAEKYGIGTKRKYIELNLCFPDEGGAPAAEVLMQGGNCTEIVKTFDLRHQGAQLSLEIATLGENTSYPIAPALRVLGSGATADYVAKHFGIQSKEGLRLLSRIASGKAASDRKLHELLMWPACDSENPKFESHVIKRV